MTPEELEHFKDSEAREWVNRSRNKVKEAGKKEAALWWSKVVLDIERIRGADGAYDLRRRMQQQKGEA